jgi:hypothetical protein
LVVLVFNQADFLWQPTNNNLCVVQVVEEMVSQAGPGGAYERTLLLVFGDHGQTMSGDHGGGTPEEVDSVLFALNLGRFWALRQSGQNSGDSMLAPPGVMPQVSCGLGAPCTCGSWHALNEGSTACLWVQYCRTFPWCMLLAFASTLIPWFSSF